MRMSALPTYSFFTLKDYQANDLKEPYHHVYVGRPAGTKDANLPVLTPGRWYIGVMNQPEISSGFEGGKEAFYYRLRVILSEESEDLCGLDCGDEGVCVPRNISAGQMLPR